MFAFLLGLSALMTASAAAFFSVYGLAQLYAGAKIPVIIMGIALEAGKLMGASFLYRRWKTLGLFFKTIFISMIAILMLITSLGIFGYLSSAYQTDNIVLKDNEQKIQLIESELSRLNVRKLQIDKQIAEMPATYVSAKQKLMQSFNDEYKSILNDTSRLNTEIMQLKSTSLQNEAKIGPIIFVAKAFGKDPDIAVVIFTLLLIFVFDPLALVLTIATNIIMNPEKIKNDTTNENNTDVGTDISSNTPEINTMLVQINDQLTQLNKQNELRSSLRK